MGNFMKILLCDARDDIPQLSWHDIPLNQSGHLTVGEALQYLNIADSKDDERISRKGCFGVFGKRKDWDSPLYNEDRLELYQALIIDPMQARRKKANRNKDARLQAKAAGRKGRFLSKSE